MAYDEPPKGKGKGKMDFYGEPPKGKGKKGKGDGKGKMDFYDETPNGKGKKGEGCKPPVLMFSTAGREHSCHCGKRGYEFTMAPLCFSKSGPSIIVELFESNHAQLNICEDENKILVINNDLGPGILVCYVAGLGYRLTSAFWDEQFGLTRYFFERLGGPSNADHSQAHLDQLTARLDRDTVSWQRERAQFQGQVEGLHAKVEAEQRNSTTLGASAAAQKEANAAELASQNWLRFGYDFVRTSQATLRAEMSETVSLLRTHHAEKVAELEARAYAAATESSDLREQLIIALKSVGRAPLVPIDEDEAVVPPETAYHQRIVMSAPASEDSMSTVSSEWVVTSGASDDGCDGGTRGTMATACVPEASQIAMSAPAAWMPSKCLLPDDAVLGGDGNVIAVRDLRGGTIIRCLRKGDGDASWICVEALVAATRMDMERETDIVEIVLEGVEGKLCVTKSHSVLTTSESFDWTALTAGELRPGVHRMFVEWLDNGAFDKDRFPLVQSVSQAVRTCQVVELELTGAADVLFLQMADGIFAGIFGTTGWTPMQVCTKNTSVDVVADAGSSPAARSSLSDPSYSRQGTPARAFGWIARPHGANCATWCNFHFSESGCKKGYLCAMCHHADHQAQAEDYAKNRKTHRGKQR